MIALAGFSNATTEHEKLVVPQIFKQGSLYATILQVLGNHPCGISRNKLADLVREQIGMDKEPRLIKYAISVVTSPSADGTAHRSANTAANYYWVEKQNDFLIMHLRENVIIPK